MITIKTLAPGVLKVVAPEKLTADDFAELAPQVDSIIKQGGKIRLLIDASRLDHWEDIAALETHAAFVKASGGWVVSDPSEPFAGGLDNGWS